ncbi:MULTISPECIES: hypothetical protein [Streptomyces]|nr:MULTISPECIES: hypothetical protein [Streptomyces]EIF93511.1 hypothetical protein [Streptomyces tsukubensis NRRL18488]
MSVVPRPAPPPDETAFRPPEGRRHMIIRRALTLAVILLLIGIPAGYLVVSAEQSRASGRDKAAESSSTGLRDAWPSQMKRRIFEVPIPRGSERVAYYETSNWRTSRLFVQFTTTPAGLDEFLGAIGADRAALQPGVPAISAKDAATVGWNFTPGERAWSGLVHPRAAPRPGQHIVVDETLVFAPRVYVVSATTP